MRAFVLKVRLSEKEEQALRKEAKRQGVSMSELVRDFVKSLEKKGNK